MQTTSCSPVRLNRKKSCGHQTMGWFVNWLNVRQDVPLLNCLPRFGYTTSVILVGRVLNWRHQVVPSILFLNEVGRPLFSGTLGSLLAASGTEVIRRSDELVLMLHWQLQVLFALILSLIDTSSHELLLSYLSAELQTPHRTQIVMNALVWEVVILKPGLVVEEDTLVCHLNISGV